MLRKQGLSSTETLGDPCMLPGSHQNRDASISAEHGGPLQLPIHKSEPSPAPLAQSAHPPTTLSRVAKIGLHQSRSPQMIGKEMGHNRTEITRKPHTSVHRYGAALKPTIALSAGTAKAVSISQRPTPPSKPKCGTSASVEPEQEHALERQVPSADPQRRELLQGFVALTSANDKGIISEGSPQSDGSLWPMASKRKRMPKREAQVPTHSEWEERIQKGTVAPDCTHVVKTTSELLEEAKYICGTGPGGKGEGQLQQMPPEETLTIVSAPMRDSRIMEQEEITVQVTKEPMEKALQVRNADIRESSGKKEFSSQQPLCHEDRCPSKLALQSPALFAVLNMADHLSESDSVTCSQDGITMVSALPQEVTQTDTMVVRGSTIVPVQRRVRDSHHCGLQRFSFLGTWMPKTSADEYKTIHHLCMTLTCQALPLDLQLSLQVCHAPSKLPSSCVFYQQRAASSHISNLPDRPRYSYKTVSTAVLGFNF
ncbi:hypothetical protein SKAU_G00211130 [Synaphobranchus kaupii]|uniref:Uncharacterized protein n=1 Tax=Synaphobranchus kaupii TaxID=118154 RepID=A0A9Q1F8W2_SYNKA|nr:hypothetical protein SKAU_G00211130 [Synaphobranchus kaupii]